MQFWKNANALQFHQYSSMVIILKKNEIIKNPYNFLKDKIKIIKIGDKYVDKYVDKHIDKIKNLWNSDDDTLAIKYSDNYWKFQKTIITNIWNYNVGTITEQYMPIIWYGKPMDIYYVDHLFIHRKYRNYGCAPFLIQNVLNNGSNRDYPVWIFRKDDKPLKIRHWTCTYYYFYDYSSDYLGDYKYNILDDKQSNSVIQQKHELLKLILKNQNKNELNLNLNHWAKLLNSIKFKKLFTKINKCFIVYEIIQGNGIWKSLGKMIQIIAVFGTIQNPEEIITYFNKIHKIKKILLLKTGLNYKLQEVFPFNQLSKVYFYAWNLGFPNGILQIEKVNLPFF